MYNGCVWKVQKCKQPKSKEPKTMCYTCASLYKAMMCDTIKLNQKKEEEKRNRKNKRQEKRVNYFIEGYQMLSSFWALTRFMELAVLLISRLLDFSFG